MRKANCIYCGEHANVNFSIFGPAKSGEYCSECYEEYGLAMPGKPWCLIGPPDDISPWQANAIRDLEETLSTLGDV